MEDRLNELHSSIGVFQMQETFAEHLLGSKQTRLQGIDISGNNAEHMASTMSFFTCHEVVNDIEIPGAIPMLKAKDIKLRDLIKNIVHTTKEMHRIIVDSNQATSVKKNEELSEAMSAMIEEGKQSSKHVQDIIEELREIQSGITQPVLTTPAERQMCTNVLATACRGWKGALVDFMDTQDKYKENRKAKLKRQLKITFPTDSEKMIEEYINGVGGDRANAALSFKLAGSARRQNNPNDLTDLRYRDLKLLEESAYELKQQYTYLEQVVIANQDFVDNIENTVKSTANFVEQGGRDLEEIRVQRSKYTKKKFFCCAGIMSLAVMIATFVVIK